MQCTSKSTFHWQDTKYLIEFADKLEDLCVILKTGSRMGLCAPLVHTLNKSNCVTKMLVHNLICYIFIYVLACIQLLLIHNVEIGVCFCNRNCRVKLFLSWYPVVVKLHLLLVTIRKWCQCIPSTVKMDAFTLISGGKSWPSVHLGKSETMLCSCSTRAIMGFSCSLRPCRDQMHTCCSAMMAWIVFDDVVI